MPRPPIPVSLKYDVHNPSDPLRAVPDKVPVRPGDTITFGLDDSTKSANPGCTFRITLEAPEHFSQKVLPGPEQSSASDLVLGVHPIPADVFANLKQSFVNSPEPKPPISHFKCELFNSTGQLIAKAGTGGEIVPDTGSGA